MRYVLRKWFKTGEEFYREPFSRRICTMDVRIFLIPKWEHPPTINANEERSTGKPVAHFSRTHVASISEEVSEASTGKPVAVTLTTEYKVYHTQQSRKKTPIAMGIVKKGLIRQFENHPNRDSLMEDLNKTEEFNPFSEKSKELITSMGDTEYIELCEISSKIQLPDCSSYWEVGIVNCTCGKCMQPSERNRQLNKARYDVLSITGYVIKNNPAFGARHGPTMRRYRYYKAHEVQKKAHMHDYRNILDRWYRYDKYPKSLAGIGWNEEGKNSIRPDRIRKPLLHCNKRTNNSDREFMEFRIECRRCTPDHWMSAVTLKRRSKDAKNCSTNVQESLEVDTNATSPTKGWSTIWNAWRNTHIDLMLLQDGDTILLPQRSHLRHHDGNQATCGQRGIEIRGNLHPGVNSIF